MSRNEFEFTTIARLDFDKDLPESEDNGKAVVILAFSHNPSKCYVKICLGTDQWGKKEFWIDSENLREY